MTDTTLCPLCTRNVAINKRTFVVRKHRVSSDRGADVCDGSGRLFVVPASAERLQRLDNQTENSNTYTVYDSDDRPIITCSRELAQQITAEIDDVFCVSDSLEEVIDAYALAPRADALRIRWSYLPQWICSVRAELWSALPHVRSQTCQRLIAIPSRAKSHYALRMRDTLNDTLSAASGYLRAEISDALEFINSQTDYPPRPWLFPLPLIVSILRAAGAERGDDIWSLLTLNILPHSDERLRGLLRVIYDAETRLVSEYSHHPEFRAALTTSLDIRDEIVALRLYRAESC